MRYLVLSVTFLLLVNMSVLAGGQQEQFQEANTLYREGQFDGAIRKYKIILESVSSADVYYNAGNAAFKLNRLGSAILNYERAKRLTPRDGDVRANLKYAQSLLEYRVEDKRNWYWRQIESGLSFIRIDEMFTVIGILYAIVMACAVISFVRKKKFVIGGFTGMLLALGILTSILAGLKYHHTYIQRDAIVTENRVKVRFGPSEDERLAFRLVEGIHVAVVDEIDNWYRIALSNGESGWVPSSGLSMV